jgi:hypothetical protein
MTEARFENPATVLAFMFAGKAVFTLRSLRSGNRYTYKVSTAPEREQDKGKGGKPAFFVAVLSGPDNTNDFTYIGMLRDGKFFTTRASKMNMDSLPVKTFNWALTSFNKNVRAFPQDLEVWHTGRCGRCGRELTVPESVATGFGPECTAIMGGHQVSLPLNLETPAQKEERLAEESYREKTMRQAGRDELRRLG